MDKGHNKKIRLLLFFVLCFFLLMFHAFFKFEKTFLSMEMHQKQEELGKTAKIKAETIQKKYANMVSSLQALAENVKGLTGDLDQVSRQMVLVVQSGYFDYVGASDAQGNAMDSEQHRTNIQKREYFKDAMEGKISISDVLDSQVKEGEEVQVLAVPIWEDGVSCGVIFGIVNVGTMDKLMENVTGSDIYTQIVDSKGNYVTRFQNKDTLIQNKNVWDDFAEYEFLEGSLEKIKDDMEKQKSDSFEFRKGEEERFSFYTPLGLKEYYVFSTINSEYIKQWTGKINEEIYFMILEMGTAFLLLLAGLYWFNKKVQEELQTSHTEAVSSEELMRIAIQESKQIVFEYDINTKRLWKKAGVENCLLSNSVMSRIPESVLEKNLIAESSVEDFKDIFEQIQEKEVLEKIIKVKAENQIQWFKIIIKNIFDGKHHILNTVGIIEDVTEKKVQEELLQEGQKENQNLKERAEKDGLTGLYNAATVKMKVQEFLASSRCKEGTHLFVLMDLDNFKQINDTFGHQYGDQVLKEVADTLRRKFRRDDILGRLGGDEFAALLLNATSFEVMDPVFLELCAALKKTYTKDGKSVTISASFGIAEAPEYGTTFEELYEKSDLMLYKVKEDSKNGYQAYKG